MNFFIFKEETTITERTLNQTELSFALVQEWNKGSKDIKLIGIILINVELSDLTSTEIY